jgi:hypothetical protein
VKKLTAILFLSLFVFNLLGLKLVYFVLQQNADSQFMVLVDNKQFDSRDLIEITIPNPIPYTKASANFDRVDGEINYKNKVYKYVYRKISENYIRILCLPDAKKTGLKQAQQKFERNANNAGQATKSNKQSNSTVKVNLSDFDYTQCLFLFKNSEVNINKNLFPDNFKLKAQAQKVALLPPENIVSNPFV